jgi:hypothetical protein
MLSFYKTVATIQFLRDCLLTQSLVVYKQTLYMYIESCLSQLFFRTLHLDSPDK